MSAESLSPATHGILLLQRIWIFLDLTYINSSSRLTSHEEAKISSATCITQVLDQAKDNLSIVGGASLALVLLRHWSHDCHVLPILLLLYTTPVLLISFYFINFTFQGFKLLNT